MGFPLVQYCCCCINLKIGAIISAMITIMWNLLEVGSGIAIIVRSDLYSSYGYVAIIPMFSIAIFLLFIFAVVKEKPLLIIPSLVWTAICILFHILTPIVLVILRMTFDFKIKDPLWAVQIKTILIIACVIQFILVVWHAYFWIIQFSSHELFKKSNKSDENDISDNDMVI
ncbi:uncharacterized protein LOC116337790 [Contarinia nasturtii]|uniref:uncharacterized protein LOC116337790 n=1 Tax=Contarinia nasturtii TaxID=265458 RepID=UPI0012D3E08D|nr:uncharacterized protein LOC116337790 [Contarinia nasturtii]